MCVLLGPLRKCGKLVHVGLDGEEKVLVVIEWMVRESD